VDRGVYRIELDVDGYFASLGIAPFYPTITVSLRVQSPERSYTVPVLITPYAYLTYAYK
jgi:5-hydroxyisourate hydrolase-like protein (transthyretin family)